MTGEKILYDLVNTPSLHVKKRTMTGRVIISDYTQRVRFSEWNKADSVLFSE